MQRFLLLLIYFIIFLANLCFANNSYLEHPHAKIRLISGHENNQDYLGLHFKLDEGWHIYTNNPGSIGMPTTIGSSTSHILVNNIFWPKHKIVTHDDGSTSNIYENEVVIPFTIDQVIEGSNLKFNVSFVVCNDMCIPITTEVSYQHIKDNILLKKFLSKAPSIARTDNPNKFLNLIIILLTAFAGGFILNFMPCVLPVLSIKLMSILNNKQYDHQTIKSSFLATSCGIICSFIIIAIITCILMSLGKSVGFGLHFQQPAFIIALIIILIIFTINLLEKIQVSLPASLNDIIIKYLPKNDKNIISSFFNGMFTTILATPCTAPLVGSAISFALSQGCPEIFLIFTLMGTGLASPYILVSFYPRLIDYLPKPGNWMVKLKKLMAIFLVITILWLLVVISNQLGELAAFLLFLIILLLKFCLTENSGFLSNIKYKIISCLILIILAFYIPFENAKNIDSYENYIDEIWQKFDPNKIDNLVKEGKIIVIDFTADWCISCKINKLTTLNRPDILYYLKHNQVIAMRANLTKDNLQAVDFMKKFNRHGIPFNVIYGPKAPNGIPLSEILTTDLLKNSLKQAGLSIDVK
jgi:suppressor for copper-sensitivity B